MGREGRDYWEEQLSEYWDSGLMRLPPKTGQLDLA